MENNFENKFYEATLDTSGFISTQELSFDTIEEALQNLNNHENYDFFFFNLNVDGLQNLSSEDLVIQDNFLLNNLYITTADKSYIGQIDDFLSSVTKSEEVKVTLNKYIISIIDQITLATSQEGAEILIDLQPESKEVFIDRHVDKTQEEVIIKKYIPEKQLNHDFKSTRYIATLIGEPTIYYLCPDYIKSEFLKYTFETESTYGEYNSEYPHEIKKLMPSCQKLFAPKGYGSFHYTGYKGAIHARPFSHGVRLSLIVTPNDLKTLRILEHMSNNRS